MGEVRSMTKQPSIAGITLRFWFMALFLLFALPDVTLGLNMDKMLANSEILGDQGTTPASHKVSSSLRAVMGEMAARGITRQNARVRGASALSSRLVKVNEEGTIQTYIHVYPIGETEKAVLETYEVAIEIINEELGIIQAWIPFDRIDLVAQLPFVKRITPPSYATPRKIK